MSTETYLYFNLSIVYGNLALIVKSRTAKICLIIAATCNLALALMSIA